VSEELKRAVGEIIKSCSVVSCPKQREIDYCFLGMAEMY